MANQVRFAFTEVDPSLGALSTLPYLPLTLTYQSQSLNVSGLLYTGYSVEPTSKSLFFADIFWLVRFQRNVRHLLLQYQSASSEF